MKRIIYIFVLLTAIFITSCDRFEHTFKPVETVEINSVLFEPLQTAFESITASDISAVMAFYDEAYVHNSQLKANRDDFYLGLFELSDTLNFAVTLVASLPINVTDTLSTSTWRLVVTNSVKEVIADSTFYDENLIRRGNNWLLYGNRNQCCPPVTYKERLIIESFTGMTCASCPQVDADLHTLQANFPNKVTYLAYHIGDPMYVGDDEEYRYYGNGSPSQPTVVFQGKNKIIGHSTTNATFFNSLANQITSTETKIRMSTLNYGVADNALSGTVRLEVMDENIDTSLLLLKFAIIDRVSDSYTYLPSHEPCRNVVLAKGKKPLNNADFTQPLEFYLPFIGTLPTDSYLVIWVQVKPATFDANAIIYNGLESFIPVK